MSCLISTMMHSVAYLTNMPKTSKAVPKFVHLHLGSR